MMLCPRYVATSVSVIQEICNKPTSVFKVFMLRKETLA